MCFEIVAKRVSRVQKNCIFYIYILKKSNYFCAMNLNIEYIKSILLLYIYHF